MSTKFSKTMIAVSERYGDHSNIEIVEKDTPQIKDNEILIKVFYSGITRADTMMRKGEPRFARMFLGLKKPNNLSLEHVFQEQLYPLVGPFLTTRLEMKSLVRLV